MTRNHLGSPWFILLVTLAVAVVLVRGHEAECDALADDDAACLRPSLCDTADTFRQRVRHALHEEDGTLRNLDLRGTLDNVLTAAECQDMVHHLPIQAFVQGSGYENHNDYAAPAAVAGLTLTDVSLSTLLSAAVYEALVEFRERAWTATERALNLCPGTLRVHYTQLVQKTIGGQHGYVRVQKWT